MSAEPKVREGDRVKVVGDQDGAAGKVATIGRVYRSGRCRVDFPDGSFRNLPPESLEVVSREDPS